MKKKKRKKIKKIPLALARVLSGIFLILSLVGDGLILFVGYAGFHYDMLAEKYVLYLIVFSGMIGAALGLLLGWITRNHKKANRESLWVLPIRTIALFIINLVAVQVNKNWHYSPTDADVSGFTISVLFFGALFFGAQLVVSVLIASSLCKDKGPQKVVSVSYGRRSSSPKVDPLTQTDYYKEKYKEYYNIYMGYPPSEEKVDTSFLDDHDYSDIFKDKNF